MHFSKGLLASKHRYTSKTTAKMQQCNRLLYLTVFKVRNPRITNHTPINVDVMV